jgi:hypothetical protein
MRTSKFCWPICTALLAGSAYSQNIRYYSIDEEILHGGIYNYDGSFFLIDGWDYAFSAAHCSQNSEYICLLADSNYFVFSIPRSLDVTKGSDWIFAGYKFSATDVYVAGGDRLFLIAATHRQESANAKTALPSMEFLFSMNHGVLSFKKASNSSESQYIFTEPLSLERIESNHLYATIQDSIVKKLASNIDFSPQELSEFVFENVDRPP